MLKYDDKAILYDPESWKDASWFKKIRARFWDSWIYGIYQYSWAYKIRWFLKHWWCHDNWVKTNLDISYHDKPQLMEDALFSLVENYVARDQEDAFSVVVVEDEDRAKIIEIIHFYRIRKPELQKKCGDILHDCFGPVESTFTPCEDRPGFSVWNTKYKGPMTEEEREAKIDEMRKLEEQIFNETQEMLKKCVEVRPILWS